MYDREIFDVLVADAPTPGPGHVTRVLKRAHRARRRRRLAGAGASLGVIALSMASAAAVASVAPGERGTVPPGAASTAASRKPADAAGPYVVALRTLAEAVREGGPRWTVLYVLDHTCDNVATPTEGACNPKPLPPGVREGLVAGLAPYAPVRFVADRASVTGPDLVIIDGGALATFGPVESGGDEVRVPLAVQHTGMNGRGLTYRVVRHGGEWTVGGTVGPMWIS